MPWETRVPRVCTPNPLTDAVQSQGAAAEMVPAPTEADGASHTGSRWAQGPAGGGRAFLSRGSPRSERCSPSPRPRSPPALAARLCLRRCLYSLQLMKIFIILLAAAAEEVQICISSANHAAQAEPVTQQH